MSEEKTILSVVHSDEQMGMIRPPIRLDGGSGVDLLVTEINAQQIYEAKNENPDLELKNLTKLFADLGVVNPDLLMIVVSLDYSEDPIETRDLIEKVVKFDKSLLISTRDVGVNKSQWDEVLYHPFFYSVIPGVILNMLSA